MLTDLHGIPLKVGDKVIMEVPTYHFIKNKYISAVVIEELKNKKVKVLSVCGTTRTVSIFSIWADVGNPTISEEGTPVVGSYVIASFNGFNGAAKITTVDNFDNTAELVVVFGKLSQSNVKWVSQNTLRYVDSYMEYLIENHPELVI